MCIGILKVGWILIDSGGAATNSLNGCISCCDSKVIGLPPDNERDMFLFFSFDLFTS